MLAEGYAVNILSRGQEHLSTSRDPKDQPLIFWRGKYHGLVVGDESAPLWPLPIRY
jgi:hypothetical protein